MICKHSLLKPHMFNYVFTIGNNNSLILQITHPPVILDIDHGKRLHRHSCVQTLPKHSQFIYNPWSAIATAATSLAWPDPFAQGVID